jgi:DNA-binding NarL/FixJ family response regulator
MRACAIDPIRVLLVDDHKTVLWGLEKLIDGEQPLMQVVGKATRCAETLVAVEHHRPDVLLLDVDLEEDNGLDILDALSGRNRPNVLIVSGLRDAEMLECAMRKGARGAVCKSESAETILKAIVHVHKGEFWLPRVSMAKILASALTRGNVENGPEPATADAPLTPTERRVIAAVVQLKGAPNKVIAGALGISCNTLRNHLASIYGKVDVHSRLDLYLYAKEHGLEKHAA